MTDTKILKITDDVKWIGVLDPDLITFDVVMETKYGTTYNSYFINADKKTIVETTKERFWDTYLQKITAVCNPSEIEYIILNHTEPDHSGNVKNLLKIAPKACVVGSGNAIRYLNDLLGEEFKHLIVKDGDVLDLGNKKIKFISAPHLHWPDTMYSYLEEDKVLFTCDSFGAHFCDERMYDTEVGNWDDAFKYYFDVIMKPYSRFLLKAIEKIRPLEIYAICNGHGPLLIETWKRYVDLSEEMAKSAIALPEENRVLVAYVSAYQNTAILADKIAQGLRQNPELIVDVCDIETMPLEKLEDKIAKSNAIIIGCPTINQNILLQVYTMFSIINPLREKGKLAGAFGSYGWSGEGAKIIENNLRSLKLNFFNESLFVKFTPHDEQLNKCLAYGYAFGQKMLEPK
ncbi:MAG: FprA family A-type flavoprotein [Bacteroidales bacterium]